MNAYEIKTGLPREQISRMMDAETWMDANKAVDLRFADDILKRDAIQEDMLARPFVSMLYSKAAVTNSLMEKLAARCRIVKPKEAETGRSVDELMERLSIIRRCI